LKGEKKMKRLFVTCGIAFLTLWLTGCGPSAEEVATMTASAWTPTPLPTATPTPVPYDLTLTIVDQDGSPISGTSVSFPESGDDAPLPVDEKGQITWKNLPVSSGTLRISAQGYLPANQSLDLERGQNESVITLERDSYGILPSEACAPGETLLYVEDFQDGEAQGWSVGDGGETPNQPFTVGPAPDDPNNQVLALAESNGEAGQWIGTNYYGDDPYANYYGDAVWRMNFQVNQPTTVALNWHEAGPSEFNNMEVSGTDYGIRLRGGAANLVEVNRLIFGPDGAPLGSDQGGGQVAEGTFVLKPETWHFLELSTYQGHLQIWLNGKSEVDFQDPLALPPGTMGIWFGGQVDEPLTSVISIDRITVCQLSAEFTSIAPPASP
jgi:hypothetical protein